MKKFLLIQALVLSFGMLATRGFAQVMSNRKYFGLQFGAGVFSFNTNQYNAVATYSDSHVKSWNTYPQIVFALSAFPVTSKFNVDIGTGGWETVHRTFKDIAPRAQSTNGFSLHQPFAYGEVNFDYRILGTPRTLIIPSIGVGYMTNGISYKYKSPADVQADKNESDDDCDEDDNNSHIYVAKNHLYYLNFRLNYLIHANKTLWYGLQIGYKYSFAENNVLYNPNFPANTNHLLNGFYASVIIAL